MGKLTNEYKHCWMQKVFDSEKGRTTKLNDIFMPGCHDAGTYAIDAASPVAHEEVAAETRKQTLDKVMSIPFIGYIFKAHLVVPYAKAQNKTIYEQLCDGIRYFDLRPCAVDGGISITHTLVSINIDEVLTDVERFTKENPKEIILLHCPFIWGQRDHVVQSLYKKMSDRLGKVMANTVNLNATSTLYEFWEAKAQVLLFVDGEIQPHLSDHIWPQKRLSRLDNSGNPKKTCEANIKHINAEIGTLPTDQFRIIPCQISPMEDLGKSLSTHVKANKEFLYDLLILWDVPLEDIPDDVWLLITDVPLDFWEIARKLFKGTLESYAESNEHMIPSIENSWNDKGYIFTFDFYDNCNVVDKIIALNLRD